MTQLLLVAVVVFPAVVGLVLLGAGRLRWITRWAGWIAVTTLAATTLASWPVTRNGPRVSTEFVAGADVGLAATGPAVLLLPTVLVVAGLVLVVATSVAETREPRFAGKMLLFTAAAALTVLATTLPTLLLGWELMGAASYALIGYRYREPRRVASGATAFLTTRTADLGLYLAAAAALAGGTDLTLDALPGLEAGWRDVAAAGILIAALGKAAQLPFSFWLARAMDGPSPVSALLHSAAMVALGGYLLLRVHPLLDATSWAAPTTAWAGAATALALGAVAIVQTDLKRLLAASTAAQLGFVVLAAGVGATAAGTAHLVAHAAVKALLFLAAGAWLEALGSKRLDVLAGAARRWPALGLLAGAALLALAGLPPLSLWATKDAVLAGVREESVALYVVALVATVLSVVYATVALVTLARPVRDTAPSAEDAGRVPRRTPLALAPLGLGAVVLGVLTLPDVLARVPGEVPVEPSTVELVSSTLLVVVTAALAGGVLWRRPRIPGAGAGPVVGFLGDWLGLEAAAHRLVVRPTLRLAEASARFDDRVLAGAVTGVARTGLGLARTARRGDVALDGGVRGIAGALTRAGRAVRRTSGSGQLHHYYLALVAVLLVVLVAVSLVVVLSSQG